MGREIRRVPPNWQHPKVNHPNYRTGRMEECYQPLFDRDAEAKFAEWSKAYAEWITTEGDRVRAEYGADKYPVDQPYRSFCAWHGEPPDPAYHRPLWPEGTATWYQVYETVTEGTPVSPAFATRDELVHWLVNDGKGMGIGGSAQTMTRKAAERFADAGSAPSMVHTPEKGLRSGVEVFDEDDHP